MLTNPIIYGRIICGDVLEEMAKLPDKSINCVITSPPYWQLRDYGYSEQWGLEPTYQEYLEHLWQFMNECYRVLNTEGTVWINLADSYSHSGGTGSTGLESRNFMQKAKSHKVAGMPVKCKLMLPERFAIGCIDRGWTIRNDIIWCKPNGLPESVKDRFTKKHEHIFFMVKQRKYFFDLDAVKVPWKQQSIKRQYRAVSGENKYVNDRQKIHKPRAKGEEVTGDFMGNPGDYWIVSCKSNKSGHFATYNTELIERAVLAGCPEGGIVLDPFCGTGTTLLAARQHNRRWVGIDASAEYCRIAEESMKNNAVIQLKIKLGELR